MGKTYKDQTRYDQKKKFPRVPPILKRSEPFEDKRRKNPKHKVKIVDEECELFPEPTDEEKRDWEDYRYGDYDPNEGF